MTTKGANRRGSIYQDKAGLWWAQLPADEQGRRPKASAETEQEAVKKLRVLERKRDQRIDISQSRQTVEQLLNLWLDEYVTHNAKPKTLEGHRYVCEHYIIPHLGRIRIDALNVVHLQRWLNSLRAAGLSGWTLKNAFMRLKTALNIAVKARLLAENVSNLVVPPSPEPAEINPLTPAELAQLFEATRTHRLVALLHIAARLGLRRGELIGLRWSDVNLERAELRVATQIQQIGGKTTRTSVKSRAGNRLLPLDADLIQILRDHQHNQVEEQRLIGEAWQDHGLVFPSECGTPIGVRSLARQVDGLLAMAGLPRRRIHDLRHTAATLMLAAGVPIIDVSRILGHSNPEVTARVYAHSLEENRKRAVAAVTQLLKR